MGIDTGTGTAVFTTAFTLLNTLIILVSLGLSIYAFILFVKLARRGIKALDYYIENTTENTTEINNSKKEG